MPSELCLLKSQVLEWGCACPYSHLAARGLLGELLVEHRDLEAVSISPELWLLLMSLESERRGCRQGGRRDGDRMTITVRLAGASNDLAVILPLHHCIGLRWLKAQTLKSDFIGSTPDLLPSSSVTLCKFPNFLKVTFPICKMGTIRVVMASGCCVLPPKVPRGTLTCVKGPVTHRKLGSMNQ